MKIWSIWQAETFLCMAMQLVLLKSITYLNKIYTEIGYESMETICNMLGDPEITWKHLKINTVQSNIIYKSCE